MFGRGICEKYQSRDEKFPEPNGEGNLVSRLVFFRKVSIFCTALYVTHYNVFDSKPVNETDSNLEI
jgi:hypothetical protein